MQRPASLLSILGFFLLSFSAHAQVDPTIQKAKEEVKTLLNASYEQDKKTSRQIWEYAEVGFKESKSAALHVQHLQEAGFKVTTGVGAMPTAFMASFGTGKPVIGILAEYDALPGLAQEGGNPEKLILPNNCLLYTSPSPRDRTRSRMPSSA